MTREIDKARDAIWESIIDRAEILHDSCVERDRSAPVVERVAQDIVSLAKALQLVGAKPRQTK